ncbi:hypothetical protein BsWGS_21062 [Bradybaena similaris]
MNILFLPSPRIMYKTLDFDVEILDAVFNRPGRYFVKMTIQSLATKDYSKVLVRKWPDETFARDYEALTSVVTQKGTENEPELCLFEDKKFTFRLPAGFCKNDRNHDVYLLLEAFSLPSNDVDSGKKMGEGKMAIYPRTNAPRTNHTVSPGEDMYRHTTVVSLLRATNKQGKAEMHCGRMRCNFALKEFDLEAQKRQQLEEEERQRREETERLEEERKTEEERLAAERKRDDEERRKREDMEKNLLTENPFQPRPKVVHTPGPYDQPAPATTKRAPTPISEWGDSTSINLPVTPPGESLLDELRKTIDSPLRENDRSTYSANQTWRHTARPGQEQVDVIIHGASNLPDASNGKMPQPFATLKTKADMDANRKAKSRTHAVVKPTNAPSWEEMVTMEIDGKNSDKTGLVLAVNDNISREELSRYNIPVSSLQPFHQYHVEMVTPARGGHEGVKVYASIVRKLASLPEDPSSPNYLGLEVFLRGVKFPLQNPMGPIIAVARIVPDYYNYKNDNLLSNPRAAGVTMFSVSFPNPPPHTFSVTGRSSHGYPQLSLLGRPEEQPRWNHPFLFCDQKDKATMFTPSAALVIEYYVANNAMTDEFWRIQSPVGFSSLLLDQKVYRQLCQERAQRGLRVDGIPIMGSELRCTVERLPVIDAVLKLITTHQPTSMVAMSNLDNLPVMELRDGAGAATHTPDILQVRTPSPQSEKPDDEEEQEEEENDDNIEPGLYLQKLDKDRLPIKDGEMPPYEAVESILPEYQYIFVDPNQDTARSNKSKPPAPPSRLVNPPDRGISPQTPATRDPLDLEQTHMSVLDQQMRDLDNYRNAVQKMGHDILTLRTQVRTLEGENSKLRIDANHYDDNRKLLIDAADLDSLARPELQARYASLRQRLAAQTAELKEYKTKVQKLQNELIKKNDKEKDYLRMTHSHASQQELLQRLQDKVQRVRKLEETCKKQEKVIEKLEAVLNKFKDRAGGQKGSGNVVNEANTVLTEENKHLREQIDDLKNQLLRAGMGGGEDLEKLELYQALERAEGRIMSLERQLQDNARNWGREKEDMSIRMNEAEHGFGRSGGMILHDYPVLDSYSKPFSLPSRLDPLIR